MVSSEMIEESPPVRTRLQRMHAWAMQILTERSSPGKLAGAVTVGVFVGASPFYGFHFPLCFALATIFGLNRSLTYLAANYSIAPLFPVLAFFALQMGHFAQTGEWLPLTLTSVSEMDPAHFGREWFFGSFILGATLAVPSGIIAYIAARIYRKKHPLPPEPIKDAMKIVASEFLAQGRFVHGYIKGKFSQDPVYEQLAQKLPLPLPIVDLGCGRGQTLMLFARLQHPFKGVGLDWDETKLARAREAADEYEALHFESADVRSASFEEAGTILFIDVLHYNSPAEQESLLKEAAQKLKAGGVIYIRDLDMGQKWRSKMTRAQERVGRWVRFNRGATLSYMKADEYRAILEAEGLSVSVEPSWGETPFANVLIEAYKPE